MMTLLSRICDANFQYFQWYSLDMDRLDDRKSQTAMTGTTQSH